MCGLAWIIFFFSPSCWLSEMTLARRCKMRVLLIPNLCTVSTVPYFDCNVTTTCHIFCKNDISAVGYYWDNICGIWFGSAGFDWIMQKCQKHAIKRVCVCVGRTNKLTSLYMFKLHLFGCKITLGMICWMAKKVKLVFISRCRWVKTLYSLNVIPYRPIKVCLIDHTVYILP